MAENLNHLSKITKEDVFLRRATADDAQNLVNLLNLCYRHDEGWTNEADLIGGIRTTIAEINHTINKDASYIFVFDNPTQAQDAPILGCIGVEFCQMYGKNVAYIGTFAVLPSLQGKSIGDKFIAAVETFANRHAKSKNLDGFAMSILSHRPELLAYYQRRGYELTGDSMAFPNDGNNGTPKRDDLRLQWLFKSI